MMNLKEIKYNKFFNHINSNYRLKMLLAKVLRFIWNPYNLTIPTGYCPCQGEGYLPTGEWYYFRSRWSTCTVYVATSESHWDDSNYLFVFTEHFQEEFIAGWISPVKGYILLNKAIKQYYKQKHKQ